MFISNFKILKVSQVNSEILLHKFHVWLQNDTQQFCEKVTVIIQNNLIIKICFNFDEEKATPDHPVVKCLCDQSWQALEEASKVRELFF